MTRDPPTPLLGPKGHPHGTPWSQTWSVSALSILFIALVVMMYYRHTRLLNEYSNAIEALRQARIDLSNGYIHFCFSNDTLSPSPYDPAAGFALMSQATRAFEHSVEWLRDGTLGEEDTIAVERFSKSVEALRDLLEEWIREEPARPVLQTKLRLAYHLVDRQASALDGQIQSQLRQRSSRHGSEFILMITGATVFLAILTGMAFVSAEARKRSREALRRTEERYRLAQRLARTGTWEWNIAANKVFWSSEMPRLFGLPPGDFAHSLEEVEKLIHPDDRRQWHEDVRACVEEGKEHRLEFRTAGDGTPRWLAVYGDAERDQDGTALRLMGVVMDVTDRKRTEEAIVHERNLSDMMVDSLPGVCYLFDREGHFLRWNKTFEVIGGYSTNEFSRLHPLDFFRGTDRELIRQRIETVFHTGQGDAEAMLTAKDGSAKPYYFTGRRIEFDGKPCLIGMGIDIAERKAAEEQLRSSLREKETLLQELYHRTKNNMQVISSFLELQAAASGNEEIERIVHDSGTRIRTMALAHEKLYQARSLSQINMRDYITDLAQLLAASYNVSPHNVHIRFEVEEIQSLIDIAIPCGLVINELLSNSLKYAFPHGRKGRIDIGLHRTGEDLLELTIADNGVGLPPGFDIMRSSTLGVQLVRQIVKHQLHGSIQAETDGGVRWRIRFRQNLYSERV